jgi:AcrR family transcriptional regulator
METKRLTHDILDAARRLLLQQGYDSLSMLKIAAEVGCKAATLYYYYKNKEAIVEALIEDGNRLHYRISKEIASKHTSPLLRFEALLWTSLEFGINNPAYFEILYLLQQRNGHAEESEEQTDYRVIPGQELGVQALRDAAIENPSVVAATCFAMLNGVIVGLLRHHFYPELNLEQVKREAIRRIMESLKE